MMITDHSVDLPSGSEMCMFGIQIKTLQVYLYLQLESVRFFTQYFMSQLYFPQLVSYKQISYL